jgi:hypothetical protein
MAFVNRIAACGTFGTCRPALGSAHAVEEPDGLSLHNLHRRLGISYRIFSATRSSRGTKHRYIWRETLEAFSNERIACWHDAA